MKRNGPELPDHGLWDEVKRTIQPLGASGHTLIKATKSIALRGGPTLRSVRPPTLASEAPPLSGFDRRTAQKLARGLMEPDARLDLHGDGLEAARIRLYHFIQSQQHQGARLVLVITGKGQSPYARHTLHGLQLHHAPERDGRLRREVPQWLNEAQFRAHVIGLQPAHPKHGGGGAFYVRLRRFGRDT